MPPAWPSPACPRLIPLLQTLSLTLADKSHFQDGLIQFSTDFLPGPVTYGSPAGAGQHVTPQRPPSLEQLSTGCCSLISPGWHGEGASSCPAPGIPTRSQPWECWGSEVRRTVAAGTQGGTQGCWQWYPGMLLVAVRDCLQYPGMMMLVPRDAASSTQGCWQHYPQMIAVIPNGAGSGTQGCWQHYPGMLMLVPRDAGSDIQRCCWWYPGMLVVIPSGARAAGEAARG